MIDPESKSQADLKGMLKTLWRKISLAEENKVINSFPQLYEEHCKFGMRIRESKILVLKRLKRFFDDNTQCEQDIINRVEPTGALKDAALEHFAKLNLRETVSATTSGAALGFDLALSA
jgi:hypothetical protein